MSGSWLARDFRGQSGPGIAKVLHAWVALVLLDAWLSFASQARALVGEHGLLPAADFVRALAEERVPFREAPTLLRFASSDRAILTVAAVGIALALVALFVGRAARIAFAISIPLYLSIVVAGRTFFSFQWDNLLLETLLVAALLPRDRPARWAHVLARLLLCKLYVESAIAKLESPIGDWLDGSAMTFYYQTAPIPGPLAWTFHHLPVWWHHLESRATVAVELALPLFGFGVRPLRLLAFAGLTAFQILNLATANYGFFVYLSLGLHLFLLDERDLDRFAPLVERVRRRLRIAARRATAKSPHPIVFALRTALASSVLTAWCALSIVFAATAFAPRTLVERLGEPLGRVEEAFGPFRLVDTYHLFAAITRERVEPTIETRSGDSWTEQDLRWKPGDVGGALPVVAPHQPRLDFQLWFYGLSFRHGAPEWVSNLVDRICEHPDRVQQLFPRPLPRRPDAVRIAFYDYRFTTPDERRASHAIWHRERIGSTRELPCAAAAH